MRPEVQQEIEIRGPRPTDLNFIQSTFLKSMKDESPVGRACTTRVFFKEFPQVIDHLLSKSQILIASYREAPDTILGYLIYEPEVIHYAYVRPSCRGYRIAREMIDTAFPGAKTLTFSQTTNMAKQIRKNHPELIFNPFVLYMKGLA